MNDSEMQKIVESIGASISSGLTTRESERAASEERDYLIKKARAAMQRVVDEYQSAHEKTQSAALGELAGYCATARGNVLDGLKKDPRMPRSINYLERYNALLKMENRREVLRRLEMTLDLADSILEDAHKVDVDEALWEAASLYTNKVMRLDGITIASAEERVEDMTGEFEGDAKGMKRDRVSASFLEDAFISSMGDVAGLLSDDLIDAHKKEDAEGILDTRIGEAQKNAREVMRKSDADAARALVGKALHVARPDDFSGKAVLEVELDVSQVRELSRQVRTSFKTFREVVMDNGLYAAFSHEHSYGACNGWRFGFWWDEFLIDIVDEFLGSRPGDDPQELIPDTVEEDDGGDTLERSIERMREFNRERYWGMLDDDFEQHVDAFWYGFKKLMESVNGLYRMNPSEFNAFCNNLSQHVQDSAVELGVAYLDEHQLEEFCKSVQELTGD